jgi:hypothetical protein
METMLSDALSQIVPVVTQTLGMILLGLVTMVANKVLKRFNVKLDKETTELLQKKARQAIRIVEEQASKGLIKQGEKMISAVNLLPGNMNFEEKASIIEGELARLPGVGATEDKVIDLGGGK